MTDSRKHTDSANNTHAAAPAHDALVADLFSSRRNAISPQAHKEQLKCTNGDLLTVSFDDHQKLCAAERSSSKGEVRFKLKADEHTNLAFNKTLGELTSTYAGPQGKTVDHYYKDASIASVKLDQKNHYQSKTINQLESTGYHQVAKYDYQYFNSQGTKAASSADIDDSKPVQAIMVDEKSRHRLYNFASSNDLTGQKVKETKLFGVSAEDVRKEAHSDAAAVALVLKSHKAEEFGAILTPLGQAFDKTHSSSEIQLYRKELNDSFTKMKDFKTIAKTYVDTNFGLPADTAMTKELLTKIKDGQDPAKSVVASYMLEQAEQDQP